jgi:hypothetical protein
MEAQRNKVVAHLNDGRLLKGYTHDFVAEKASFHLNEGLEAGGGKIHEVRISDMKALFFVKTPGGNKAHKEKKRFEEVDSKSLHGMKIKVVFKDGEVMRGLSLGYSRAKQGFFIVPIDPQGNNDRIYIVAASTAQVVLGPDAEK